MKKKELAKKLLLREMEDISERFYCAGWMMGLEFSLWSMVIGGNRRYGMGEVPLNIIELLQELARDAGGWWRWNNSFGEEFICLDDWKKIYEEKR